VDEGADYQLINRRLAVHQSAQDLDFLGHHVIGPHADPKPTEWFFRSGEGPPIPCYDGRKAIGIPAPRT